MPCAVRFSSNVRWQHHSMLPPSRLQEAWQSLCMRGSAGGLRGNTYVIPTPFPEPALWCCFCAMCPWASLPCTAGDQGGDEDLTPAQRAVQHYSVLHREDEEVQLTGVSKAAGELERFYANGTPAERWAARPPACCVCFGMAFLTACSQTWHAVSLLRQHRGGLPSSSLRSAASALALPILQHLPRSLKADCLHVLPWHTMHLLRQHRGGLARLWPVAYPLGAQSCQHHCSSGRTGFLHSLRCYNVTWSAQPLHSCTAQAGTAQPSAVSIICLLTVAVVALSATQTAWDVWALPHC